MDLRRCGTSTRRAAKLRSGVYTVADSRCALELLQKASYSGLWYVGGMEEVAARIRAAGLRVTPGRVAVFRAVTVEPHIDADRVAAVARGAIGAMSTQAVYDSLRALTDAGLLRRIEPAGAAALYETRVGDNHHHLVCRSCGRIEDVSCAVGSAPCLTPAAAAGYDLDEAEVTFWGLCPACRDDRPSPVSLPQPEPITEESS